MVAKEEMKPVNNKIADLTHIVYAQFADPVWDQVHDQVWVQVNDSVGHQVWRQLLDQK